MDDSLALEICGLKQVIRTRGSSDRFTLYVRAPLKVKKGAFVGIQGQTGCGKTTLLSVLGLLRQSTKGSQLERFNLRLADTGEELDLARVWRKNQVTVADRLRCRHFGFAFQNGELLPALNVLENIEFPLIMNRWSRRARHKRLDQLVEAFQLYRTFGDASSNATSLVDAFTNHLSGGQYQRVALARAIAHQPELVFVDEPTASLNRAVARSALSQLKELRSNEGRRSTVLMVTHDVGLADEFCDEIIHMRPVGPGENGGAAGEVFFPDRDGRTKV